MRKSTNIDISSLKGFKIKLYPTDNQRKEIDRNIQVARSVYNLGLEMQNNIYENGGKYIQYFPLITEFSRMRNEDENKSWLRDVSINTIRETLHNLDNAFRRFFNKQNRYPKFKSRKHSKKSFSVRSDRTHVYGEYIRISGLKDAMILAKKHGIPEDKRMYNTVVSFDGYNYWFSGTFQHEPVIYDNKFDEQPHPIGIDVGLVNMITTSDGDFYKFSDYSKYNKRLKRQQRRLSKDFDRYYKQSLDTRTKYEDVPKSKNYYKRLKKRFDTTTKMKNKRMNDIHTATKQIVSKNISAIVIENISVREQCRNKWFRRNVDVNQIMYYEIHRQLKYKAADRGIEIIVADKGYPSSQICSKCGNRGYIKRRIFKCSHCGYKEDRDLNAAYNLRNLAVTSLPNKQMANSA